MNDVANAVMDAAERRMRSGGFNGFSFREIADDVGVKSSSVHYHFPTKKKLAAAVVRRYTDRLGATIAEELASGTDPYDMLSSSFRDTVRSANRMCPITVLGAGSLDLPEEVAIEVQRFFRMCLDKLTGRGLSENDAAELLATITGAMVVSAALGDLEMFDRATTDLLRSHVSHEASDFSREALVLAVPLAG
jgi:TetR/AcrR family transcriptional regulator, transcriptional repressor for nem operon